MPPRCVRARSTPSTRPASFPAGGQNRLRGMIEQRPDWVLSRQRAWGVPIAIFAKEDGTVLVDDEVNARILDAFEKEGADAWFAAAPQSGSWATSTIRPNGSRSATFSTSGLTRARRTPSRWKIAPT